MTLGKTPVRENILKMDRFLVVAKRALGLMLDEARAVGLDCVELTTDPKNLASQRVIAANAGLLVEWFSKPAAYGGGEALRFRIRP